MEKVSEYVSKGDENNGVKPLATEIGHEFVRQYYTKWSFQLNEVFQFYGNESVFLHDDEEAKGQEAIQKAIDKLNYNDCKARIHSVTAVYGVNNSLVIQVCGELSIDHGSPRRFLQNFVLCKQQAKKYYVQNDIFQWIDKAFCDVKSRNDANVGTGLKDNKKELTTEKNLDHLSSSQQNGHSLAQKTASPLNDLSSLAKIANENPAVKERTSTESSTTLNNNSSNNGYPLSTKGTTPHQTPKTSAQLLQQQLTTPSVQQTGVAPLSDNLPLQQPQHQQQQLQTSQQPPKHLPQQRSYGQSQQRHSQRSSYGQQQQQQQHNSHHQSTHGNVLLQPQQQQQQQPYRHQASAPLQTLSQQPVKRQDSHPKTWAKAVSNNSSSASSHQPAPHLNSYVSTNIGVNSGGNAGYNNSANNYGGGGGGGGGSSGGASHPHSNNPPQHHSQQPYRSSFAGGGGGGSGGTHQRKQFPIKSHK